MMKVFKQLSSVDNNYRQLATVNCKEVYKYNEQALSTLLLLGWILVLVPIAVIPFSETKAHAFPAYLLSLSSFFALFLLFKIPALKKYTIAGLYAGFSVLILLGIYLSVMHTPNMRATILLGGFVIAPLSFIDRSHRVISFLAFWMVVHTVLAYYLKPTQYAIDDFVNILVASILGFYLGRSMVKVRLENFEAQRLLTIEKETDLLTGLFNRRKLFETLAVLETEDSEKPSGIMMLDIDSFKEFNDQYGHAMGDKALTTLGETLIGFRQHFWIDFYRYGGEEFVAVAYGYSKKELFSIAESLRIAVQNKDMEGHRMQVSIGIAYCGKELIQNYEKIIDHADKALYAAKESGRNKVHMA